MRLLQLSPSWAQHAYLRFSGRLYVSENCVANVALGQQLPLLVDDSYMLAEKASFEYIRNDLVSVDDQLSPDDLFINSILADHLRCATEAFKTLTGLNGDSKKLHSSSSALGIGFAMGKLVDMKVYFAVAEEQW